MSDRVVLAYSGGLDTSVAIGWIAEATGAEVIAVAVDVGQGGEDLEVIRKRALECGAVEAEVADARDEFADDYCLPGPAGQRALHGPLPAGLGAVATGDRQAPGRRRPQARRHRRWRTAAPARATTRSGSRSASRNLAPEMTCIAPVRDYAMTRDKAIEFAESHGLPIDVNKKSPYSIDQNVWGRAVETGFLEDIWNGPIEDLYSYTSDPDAPRDRRRGDDHVRAGRPGRDRRQAGDHAAGDRAAQPARRSPGRRPARHRRGPAGRHQEPRGLRGARRDRPADGPRGAAERHHGARAGALLPRRLAALERAGLRRPVVLAAQAGAGRLHRRGQRTRSPATCA